MSGASSLSFIYRAQTSDGMVLHGSIDASDPNHARSQLQSLGLIIAELIPAPRPQTMHTGSVRGEDLISFNQQLAQLAAAGLPLEHGLRMIANDAPSRRMRRSIELVAKDLEAGLPLEQAFENRRGVFPPLYGRILAAGVKSGDLAGVLINLGRHLDTQRQLRAALWRALSYPMMVAIGILMVLGFLSAVVMPHMRAFFMDFGAHLPTTTQILFALTDYLLPAIAVIAALTALGIFAWMTARAMGKDRLVAEKLCHPLPLIGPVLKRDLAARWAEAMRMAVVAGLDLPAAFSLASDAVGSPALARDSARLRDLSESGRNLEEVHRLEVLPRTAVSSIDLCQTSAGRDMTRTLETLRELYQQQALHRLIVLRVVLLPVSVFAMAVVIGFIVVSLFAPLSAMLNSVMGV